MTDLLIINPGNRSQLLGNLSSTLAGIEPPVWCGLMAGFIRSHGYAVKIIDAEAENWLPDKVAQKTLEINPMLTAILVFGANPSASSTPKMTAVRDTVGALKTVAPQLKIILGGIHPSALPDQTLQEERVDFVYQGEGFNTVLKLLEIIKSGKEPADHRIEGLWQRVNGKITSTPGPPLIENLDEIYSVAWDLLPMEKYRAHNWHCFDRLDSRKPYAVIYTSLGCPFKCTFCNIHALYGKPGIRFRSPEKVIAEIDYLVKNYKMSNIKIADELFVFKRSHVVHICDLIIQKGYKLNIWCYARIDTVDQELLSLMKRAGINWIAYGIESANTRVRRDVSKRIDQQQIQKTIEMTHGANINIIGNFIFGLPEDNLESMTQTLEMAKQLDLDYVNFYAAMAYPGSQLYIDVLSQGTALPEHWYGYGQYSEETLPLPTRYLTGGEVLRFRDRAFLDYFSNPQYLDKIQNKFGKEAVQHIKAMLSHKINRLYT
jgi:anaerobic magnesium-protoporphyrin IX monomethyl ester cyclase